MKASMDKQSRLLESLHDKQDWQSKEILKLQIILLTQQENELSVETTEHPEENVEIKETEEEIKETEEEIKETEEEEREPVNSDNTKRLDIPVKKPSKIYPKLPVVIEIEETNEIVEQEIKRKEKKKAKKDKQRNNIAERKIKILGDSIVHSLDFDKVEKVVGKVSVPGKEGPGAKYDRAYGSKYDPKAQFPNNNQEYKIPQLLARDRTDILVFQASVTDITNLKKVSNINVNSI